MVTIGVVEVAVAIAVAEAAEKLFLVIAAGSAVIIAIKCEAGSVTDLVGMNYERVVTVEERTADDSVPFESEHRHRAAVDHRGGNVERDPYSTFVNQLKCTGIDRDNAVEVNRNAVNLRSLGMPVVNDNAV